ncbi:MAG: hypothetical protein V4556_02690 [Bacteroidota bacterium]
MKKFKTFDLWTSIILIIGFTIVSLINRDGTFMVGYFVVGGWQVISMIVHTIKKWFIEKRGARRIYHWITLISLATMPIGSFWILLIIAPVMAIYYTWICYYELSYKMQRPLAQFR